MALVSLDSLVQGAFSKIGHADDVCPTCLAALTKRPGRKTSCPHCRSFIFVRTRPLDRKRVLVTAAQVAFLEQEWDRFQNTRLSYMVDETELDQIRSRLTQKFGRAPLGNDIVWAYFNQQLLECGQRFQWGLYRNTRLSMAMMLERENRQDAALSGYLEVYYFDANGPINRGTFDDPGGDRRIGQGPDFSPQAVFSAPGVVERVVAVALALRLDDVRLATLFSEVATRVQGDFKTPVIPTTAWASLQAAMSQTSNWHQSGAESLVWATSGPLAR